MSRTDIRIAASAAAPRPKFGPFYFPPVRVEHSWVSTDGKTALFERRRFWTQRGVNKFIKKFF